MSSYTISITPDDDRLASTTLRVQADEHGSRITELLVRAGSGDGLSAHALPAVDLDLVIRALIPSTTRAAAVAAGPAATAADLAAAGDDTVYDEAPAGEGAPAGEIPPTGETVAADPGTGEVGLPTVVADDGADQAEDDAAAPTARPGRGRPRGSRATGTKKTAPAKRTAGAKKTATAKQTGPAKKAAPTARAAAAAARAAGAKPTEQHPTDGRARRQRASAAAPTPAASGDASGQRAYRRMPDDLAQIYSELNSVTALARHYDVPRHTAQGWVGRLRAQTGGTAG